MPGRYSMRKRSRGLSLRPIDSMKNYQVLNIGISGTQTNNLLIKAIDNPLTTAATDISRGAIVKAIWISIDACGLGGTGVLNMADAYLIKNPGANLTPPLPISYGTSNEKKHIFKTWSGMIMRNQDGNAPIHWEGWIRIPKNMQRFGTDDILQLVIQSTAGLTGHAGIRWLFKWYR